MNKTGFAFAVVLLAFILCSPTHALASWSQSLYENGLYGDPAVHYDFTKYEGFIVSDPAQTQWEDFIPADSGWTSTIVNPTYAVMEGPAVAGLNFTTFFSGNYYPGFAWDVVVWSGNQIIGGGRLSGGSSLSFDEYDVTDSSVVSMLSSYNRSPVPIPSAAWLFGAGLIGFIGARRRLLD
jgi:hypothetical protein